MPASFPYINATIRVLVTTIMLPSDQNLWEGPDCLFFTNTSNTSTIARVSEMCVLVIKKG